MTFVPAWWRGELQPVEKLTVHREGLRHKAVSVFVLRGDDVLLQKRARAKYHSGGLWTNTCCTHPLWAEPPRTCAIRRMREELGIEGLEPVERGQIEYRAEVGSGMIEHEVVDLFVAEASPDLRIDPDPEEVEATRWVSMDALAREVEAAPDRFTPWLRIYLAEHSGAIFGEAV